MDLNFKVVPSKYFLKQFEKLNVKEKNLINSKIKLMKSNPFRFKKLVGYKNTFEVKISVENSYSRLIYIIFLPETHNITIFGIFKRKNDFKDFKRKYEK